MEPACECNSVWFQDVATVDGSPISAMAYPSYPSEGFASPTLSQFFGPLASSSNLTASYQSVRADITGLCTTCATMPIFVNEYNAGPGAVPSSLGGSCANAVFLAASVTQALRANVSHLTIFNLQTASATAGYALLDANSAPETTGTLYSQVLSHLAVGTVLRGGVHSWLPDAWSVVARDASSESLLVANTQPHELRQRLDRWHFPRGSGGSGLPVVSRVDPPERLGRRPRRDLHRARPRGPSDDDDPAHDRTRRRTGTSANVALVQPHLRPERILGPRDPPAGPPGRREPGARVAGHPLPTRPRKRHLGRPPRGLTAPRGDPRPRG